MNVAAAIANAVSVPLLLVVPALVCGEELVASSAPEAFVSAAGGREAYDTGWALAFDDDVMSFHPRDADYTGGLAVTLAGRRAAEWPITLDGLTGWLDPLVPASDGGGDSGPGPLHALQIGLLAFTPEDLSNPDPVPEDRPYASLLFLSSARVFVSHPLQPVYETSFTLGILGLATAGAAQRSIHKALGTSEIPEGWHHQISNGGEPTLRATWARQALLASHAVSDRAATELKWRLEGSMGYLTEASMALSARWGRLNTPWWGLGLERAAYVSEPAPVIVNPLRRAVRELYLSAGVKARVRAYNAFLEGQFRHSDVEVAPGNIERLIGEAWVGVTWQMSRVARLSYVARYQTRELDSDPGGRRLLWAGLLISHDL